MLCDEIHNLPPRWQPFGAGDAVFPEDPYQVLQFLSMGTETIKAELEKPSNNRYIFTTQTGKKVPLTTFEDDLGTC
jgi:hypothetical protein